MTTDKRIDRKGFLTLTVAAGAAVTLGACSDDGEGGGTSGTGGTATGGTGTGGTGTGGSTASGAVGGGGASGGGTAGDGGSGGGSTLTCTTETNNGTHSHPLTVPPSDVERGFQDAPYVLEDGGTGHTHTVELTAYEFIYLAGGTPITQTSTTTLNHSHDCVITCIR